MEGVGFPAYLEKSYPGEGFERMENVRSLVSAAVEYEREVEAPTLLGFLDRSALVSDADEIGARPGVTLMTVHNAKGLEFAVVFLAGLEENIFPHSRSRDERRRPRGGAPSRATSRSRGPGSGSASRRAMSRLQQGVPQANAPSRFIEEIPAELLAESGSRGAHRSSTRPARVRAGGWRDVSYGSSAARAAARGARQPEAAPRPSDFPVAERRILGRRQGLASDVRERQDPRARRAGKSLKLTIQFTGYGTKRILPAYTQLTAEGTSSMKGSDLA